MGPEVMGCMSCNIDLEAILRECLADAFADGEQWGEQVTIREYEGKFVSTSAHERRLEKAIQEGLARFRSLTGQRDK